MTELSTADLAGGGTTARPTEPDGRLERQDRELDAAPTQDYEPQATAATSEPPTATRTQPADQTTDGAAPLFPTGEVDTFRSRWQEVQIGFVDEPRSAVEQADGLVAEMMQRLAQVFSEERARLEEQWSRGNDIDTEDLRVALQRYRSFFDRLLSV